MASAIPVEVLDDDDDFDWEAAVKEIDVACEEATKLSSSGVNSSNRTTYRNFNSHTGSCPKIENNKPSSSRQSTLDRFIGLTGSKSANQDVKHDARYKVEYNDERASDVSIDPEAAKTWIYPENISVRDYQASMTRTALFSNTLVSLPTGLGKTLIAAVVMYNYFRWFPQGKIVFAAPSRPLVLQQIKACHYIVGIPQEYTVELTGQTSPAKRVGLWKEKRVFFLTPEVLERDIEQGRCEMKQLVCLVLDEAHRATGDYAYCMVVRKLMAVPVQLRILALSATPGSKQETIQHVIDNLQISVIEHRSENDPEVTQYVQTRKVELIEVEMGKEADEVNDLLIDIIRPYITRLSPFISLPKRDINSFSPYDFVSSKDKFDQAPPQNISANKIQEIDGILLVLITLYHIRKLLSSHGIQSAFVMLEDKLKNGNFARFMNTKEEIWKAKAIMKQYMEHGIVSPKIQKLLEVLTEHFNKQDSKKSRVIIFSNFRESVSEIMASVATIGTHVKATAFIGQSSGKKSKGQTQKVQQAVLEKFRAGGYNVIVATSIGEEGLDIMEVDLVICFDANVSPLRMIQRMGRTGRKNKGRVVVLACKGPEVRGYYRKLANSKTIKKHMLNGGTSSFRFHSSPRMVPNVFRPERVMVKLLIEEYVDRGKKVKNDDVTQTPKYKLKLTNTETDLLAKYFQPLTENNWRPSLIAFPHFQAFPSRVHKVAHSIRTKMLIDTMQSLQDLSYDNHDIFFNDKYEETSEGNCKVESIEHHNSNIREDDFIQKEPESDILSPMKHCSPDVQSQKPSIHSFLFGSDFTSVDSLGRVIILSVPLFPFTKSTSPEKTVLPNHLMSDSSPIKVSHLEDLETEFDIDGVFTTPIKNDHLPESSRRNTEIPDAELDVTESIDSKAGQLSPRLTNLLMSGVVPESPIGNGTSSKEKGYPITPDHDTVPGPSISLVQNKNNEGEIRTPGNNLPNIHLEKCGSGSKFVGETRTPVTKLSDSSCSKDWMLSSGEKSISQPKPKFKRLRKFGDIKSGNLSDVEEIVGHRPCNQSGRVSNKRRRGDKKVLNDARIFIDNEAEVSSEGSGDEDVDQGQDSYDGSFIDDRINPTVANTQAECDMMAIYRRSLLTQSPLIQTPHFPVDVSPDSIIPMDQTHDNGGSTSGPTNHTHTNNHSTSVSFTTNNLSSDAGIPTTTTTGVSSTTAGVSKRKLSFTNGQSLPIRNLETEIEATAKEPPRKFEEVVDDFDSDDFYRDIDFDALEEQATRELRLKSQKINEKQNVDPNLDFFDCPSFDLGI